MVLSSEVLGLALVSPLRLGLRFWVSSAFLAVSRVCTGIKIEI